MQNLKSQFKIQNYFIFFILLYFITLSSKIQAQGIIVKNDNNQIFDKNQTIENTAISESSDEQPQLADPLEQQKDLFKEPKKIIFNIDKSTAEKGYPAASPDKNLILFLNPKVLSPNLQVEISESAEKNNNLPPNVNLLSKVYNFKLSKNNQPFLLHKFFSLIIKLNPESFLPATENNKQNKRKALYAFLEPQNKWIALKSKITKEKVVAEIDFSQATIAVFTSKESGVLKPEIQIAAENNANKENTVMENGNVEIIANQDDTTLQESKSLSLYSIINTHSFNLREDVIEKGYTVSYSPRTGEKKKIESHQADNSDRTAKIESLSSILENTQTIELKIAVLPNILSKSVNLFIKEYDKDNFPLLENYQILSNVYEYDFQDSLITLEKGKRLILEINNLPKNQYGKKEFFFLDETENKWKVLPSYYQYTNNNLRAFTYLPYSKIAVFEAENIKQGYASWFSDRLTNVKFGAASNDFPYGTILKVTNPSKAKSVQVKVISSGPFVKDRIIDLTYSAFAAIANPQKGIIEVAVETIK